MTTRSSSLAACLLALLSAVSCAKKSPELRWHPLPLGTDAAFEDLWFADSLHGWIVGGSYQIEGGLVGRTQDGGVTWEYSSGMFSGGSRLSVEAVWFLDPSRGFVTTAGGNIYSTRNGGETWDLVYSGRGSVDHLFDFDFVDDQNGFAVGRSGVTRTTDGGASWAPATDRPPSETRIDAWATDFVDTRTGWVAGQHGTLMKTEDGGATWIQATTPLSRQEPIFLFDIHFVNRETGWVVGSEGTILHTADGGSSWVRQETGVAGARSEYKPEIIQRRAGVFDTVDTGQRTPGLFLTGVRFLDAQRGWVVGHFGYEGRSVVLRTEDGGATWALEGDVAGEELRALFVLDPDHAWAIGDRNRPGSQVLLRYSAARKQPS